MLNYSGRLRQIALGLSRPHRLARALVVLGLLRMFRGGALYTDTTHAVPVFNFVDDWNKRALRS